MLEFQPDVNFDSWPKWPFVVLAIVLFLPGLLIIALAFVAWIRSPQKDVATPKVLDQSSSGESAAVEKKMTDD